MKSIVRLLTGVSAILLSVVSLASAQTAANVLVVINESSEDSVKIGEHYAKVRAIPSAQVLRIKLPVGDVIARGGYAQLIEAPIGDWLNANGAQDRILYIVLTKGVPLRIEGTLGRQGTVSSVDSELTLLYRRLTGTPVAPQGQVSNPYYLGTEPVAKAKPFSHRAHDIYLVTRLDGFTAADVIAMIDRGVKAGPVGNIVLDQKADLPPAPGENWLKDAATALSEQGFGERTVLETTTKAFAGKEPVIGYYSWGSNDPVLRSRTTALNFAPGAIAAMFLSSDARTFSEPPLSWSAGDSRESQRAYAGSSQALTGDLIRSGVTGAAGYVAEPYGDGAVRPERLFPAYVAGFNLAEAFYLATPFLSWQTIVVGDPLCAPFAASRAPVGEPLEPEIESATELPAFFSARRLKASEGAGVPVPALQAWLRGESRFAKGDKAGARESLETATKLEPRLVRAHHVLASIFEESAEYDLALTRYRAVLDHRPNDGLALNNLAYLLAVRHKDPVQALPYARRGHEILKSAESADTLGWVLHLSGDQAGAATLFSDIVRTPIRNPEILLHAATVFAAVGRSEAAARELARAVALDAKLDKREDVKALRARIVRETSEGAQAPQQVHK
jgi:uncharacterized protein (TIGR03790 family)